MGKERRALLHVEDDERHQRPGDEQQTPAREQQWLAVGEDDLQACEKVIAEGADGREEIDRRDLPVTNSVRGIEIEVMIQNIGPIGCGTVTQSSSASTPAVMTSRKSGERTKVRAALGCCASRSNSVRLCIAVSSPSWERCTRALIQAPRLLMPSSGFKPVNAT